MRSRSRSRSKTRRRTRRRTKTHRRSFRGRGGGSTVEELRNQIVTIPTFHFAGNEKNFNSKSFDKAKKWFHATFHPVENTQLWKDALWPTHAQVNSTNVLSNMMNEDKQDTSGYWTAKGHVDRISEFVIPFMQERLRKVESTASGLGRFFNPSERSDKFKQDAKSVGVFVEALKQLSEDTGIGYNI